MIDQKKILAVVPARGGSERLPRKNLMPLSGKPLIAWSIQAGLESRYTDRVIVSTDDPEIAATGRQYGADIPFMRPSSLSQETSSTLDVLKHVIHGLGQEGEIYDYLLLLQPTSPLRNSQHVDVAIEQLITQRANAIVSVTKVDHPIEWTNTLPANLSLDDFMDRSFKGLRSQDFPTRYRINGAIYIVNIIKMLEQHSLIIDKHSYAFIMNPEASVDIDNKKDFVEAFIYMKGTDSFFSEITQPGN